MKMVVRIVAFVIGVGLFLFGMFAFIGLFANFGENEDQTDYVISILLILFAGVAPLVGAFFLCKWAIQAEKVKRTNYEELENTILKAAENRGGRLTAVELAMDTELTLEEAKELLEQWVVDGYVTIKVSEGGALVYAFTGITSEGERRTAKGVSDH